MNKILWIALAMVSINVAYAQNNWQYIFNGENLDGWEKLNGTAEFSIEGDSVIVGTSELNTPNTFLATEKLYTDFILEYEVKVDNELNSGVQIRSNSFDSYNSGRVHGYQVELDPSPRAYSGGIFDEARRGWMYPLADNEPGRNAFLQGGWNHFRVEVIGNSIRTWINGQMCSNLVDDMTSEGFIALQVHSIRNEEQVGKQVRWKNIRIMTTDLEENQWPVDPNVREISYLKNELTENEIRKGWRLLWDGETTNGWIGAKLDHFPEKGWEINDGVLTILATDGGEATGPGDIITEDLYSDFELELEFKFTEGANSGIKYFVDAELNKGPGSAIGCEFQILDDQRHPDAKNGVNGNRTLSSLYDLMTGEILTAGNRVNKSTDTWHKARIVSKNGKVEHWLNNEKMVEYDRFSQMFRALVAYSKYAKWEDFGQWEQGHILLQDHGDTVHYRSIKVREF